MKETSSRKRAPRRGRAQHAAPGKPRKQARPSRITESKYDARFEMGLKSMREGDSLAAAARKINVSAKRLRRYITATGVVERSERRWVFKRDRRFRRIPIYADGRRVVITVRDLKAAQLVGQYMSAVRQFLETENVDVLAPFRGQSVPDVLRRRYVFETRPNVFFRIDASGVEPFELVYTIVKLE
jgi:hypothetical protein